MTRSAARERTEVTSGPRAHRCDMLQRLLAACFAAILAVGPFARPSTPGVLAGPPVAAPEALVAHDGAKGQQPPAELRPGQSLAPGILSRAALRQTTLGLPPVKAPLLRPIVDQPVMARSGTTVLGGEPRGLFQRSSVGTARTPTGPPA